jgi:cation diffusion facilitator CzcD-associated flavoprotein CzcO
MRRRHPRDLGKLSVAVIGAGPGGICMGVGLRRAGVERFTIYEQSSNVGGTWWDSKYPGAAVDTAQPLYAFSFAPYDFTRTHVGRDELLNYLQTVADQYRLRDNLRLNTRVDRVEWDEHEQNHLVHAADGTVERYDVVVSAVGLLNNPKHPDWPGLETFQGTKLHSSRWDPELDVRDKTVAVVGTGSTAAQIVPAIAPLVRQLYLYQRQPGWVAPKGDRPHTAQERRRLLHPIRRRVHRLRQILDYEKRLRSSRAEGTELNRAAKQACLTYIDKVFADRPDLAKLVTPDYPFGGKRPVQDNNFYPALLRDNVELVPHAVTSVTGTGVVDDVGVERDVDVLVMATGFRSAEFLATLEVVGRDGKTLRETWNGDPTALLGLMVPGFPNFYMLYGPNTNGGPIMFFHERQAEFVLGNLRRMVRRRQPALEVRAGLVKAFTAALDHRLDRMVTTRYKVHGYAFAESGREVISWGEGLTAYWLATHLTRPFACRPVRAAPAPAPAPVDPAPIGATG